MNTDFAAVQHAVATRPPRQAIVLGSGLSAVAEDVVPLATCEYRQLPDFAAPSVPGHRGELVVGSWGGVPIIVCKGRVHFYEGQPWHRVTQLVRILAELGIERLILTNAAGGLREDLNPGDLMAITGHASLLTSTDWQNLGTQVTPYSHCAPSLPSGVYAALTGPCYETPAEIRALARCGIAAVGMSTAREAVAAFHLGLKVAGVSCITNKAAGITGQALSHHEVEQTALTAQTKLKQVLTEALHAAW